MAMRIDCTLRRRKGGPITGHTIDVSPGGVCVETDRPLGLDELLNVAFLLGEQHVDGRARVVRQQGLNVYALRFEDLPADTLIRLDALSVRT